MAGQGGSGSLAGAFECVATGCHPHPFDPQSIWLELILSRKCNWDNGFHFRVLRPECGIDRRHRAAMVRP